MHTIPFSPTIASWFPHSDLSVSRLFICWVSQFNLRENRYKVCSSPINGETLAAGFPGGGHTTLDNLKYPVAEDIPPITFKKNYYLTCCSWDDLPAHGCTRYGNPEPKNFVSAANFVMVTFPVSGFCAWYSGLGCSLPLSQPSNKKTSYRSYQMRQNFCLYFFIYQPPPQVFLIFLPQLTGRRLKAGGTHTRTCCFPVYWLIV